MQELSFVEVAQVAGGTIGTMGHVDSGFCQLIAD